MGRELSTTPSPGARRHHDSSGRGAAAEQRRLMVVDCAARLFAADGWSATSLARVAEEAGVPTELVQTTFDTKAALLIAAARRASYAEMRDLPEALERLKQEPDLARRAEAMVRIACAVLPAVAPLVPVMLRAADQDPTVREAVRQARRRHAETCETVAALLSPGEPPPGAADEIFMFLLAETYLALVDDRGWSLEQYREWLRHALIDAVSGR